VYLKRLEIKGFKSFAETTEINLKPGINIVVGPNGCGKSNLVDAIRWVLGESNIRHIRGQRNEDIIFSGTDKKKSQGMAYAAITVDNNDHLLPVDFTEVTVERKSFRSGESEFFLNKSRVRMKDISDLFTGTGLGKKGYSIISQGELEQVLNGQPLERRLILEEASGIIRHRHKRDEVQKRLAMTSNDILRLGDLLAELESRRDEVGEKAARAAQYQKYHQRYTELEHLVLTYEWLKINRDIDNRRADMAARQDILTGIQQEIAAIEAGLQQRGAILQKGGQDLNSLKEKKHDYETRINNCQSEIRLGEEKIRNASERIAGAENDSTKYFSMLNSLSQDIEVTAEAFKLDQEQMELKKQEFLQVEAETGVLEEKIRQLQEEFESKKNEAFERARLETEAGNESIANEEELKRVQERHQRISIHLEDIQEKIIANQNMAAKLQEQTAGLQQMENGISREIKEFNHEREQLQQIIDGLKNDHDQSREQLHKLSSKLAANKEMQKNLAGYSSGVKALASSFKGDSKLKGMVGIVGELIDVKPGLELAVETALNRGLENIVVESMDDARAAIDLLKQRKMGRVTFLPLDALKFQPLPAALREKLRKIPGVTGLGSELVQYEARCKKAVEYLLGRVLIVENMETAIKIYHNPGFPGRIVSLEGEIINNSGAITGGHRESAQPGVIQRKGEEKELTGILQAINKKMAQTAGTIAEKKVYLDQLEQVISARKKDSMEYTLKLGLLGEEKEKMQSENDLLKQQRESYLSQLSQIEEEIVLLNEKQLALQEEKKFLQAGSSKLHEELESCQQKLETDTRDLEVGRERLRSYQEQLEMKSRELENSSKNILQFEQVKASYQQSMETAAQIKERMEKEITAENENMALKRAAIQEMDNVLQEVLREIIHCNEKTAQARNESEEYARALLPLRQKLAQTENNQRNAELNIARLETEGENMRRNWQEKYQELPTVEPADFTYKSGDIRNFNLEMGQLKTEMESLWPVDLTAVQEHEEIIARCDFQQKQYQDLVQAQDTLHKLLEETEKIMSKDFSHFLLLANESFKATFKEIFGGGEALLRLAAGADKLETGVEIEVKMPGKRTQSLDLLSGGERALTCIAFIFALLALRPAPFSLLDEIDASLDDTNLTRFTNFLNKMSANMQFIVITHRQATIAAGNNIYGVTMPEKGISSILTLSLEEAENLAG